MVSVEEKMPFLRWLWQIGVLLQTVKVLGQTLVEEYWNQAHLVALALIVWMASLWHGLLVACSEETDVATVSNELLVTATHMYCKKTTHWRRWCHCL